MLRNCRKSTAKTFCSILLIIHTIFVIVLVIHAIEAVHIHRDLKRVEQKVDALVEKVSAKPETLSEAD
jgi:cell division protein FtsL